MVVTEMTRCGKEAGERPRVLPWFPGSGDERPVSAEDIVCTSCYPEKFARSFQKNARRDLKSTLGRADPQRGRFRNFLLGALQYFLANAAEHANAGKRSG